MSNFHVSVLKCQNRVLAKYLDTFWTIFDNKVSSGVTFGKWHFFWYENIKYETMNTCNQNFAIWL